MRKNEEGRWVDGRGATATSHLQVRCNSLIKEMTCYYIDRLCGDGTPTNDTIMTAKQKFDKNTGELLEAKRTVVKKYSFSYAMAWERLSEGHGLVSRTDRETIRILGDLISKARLIHAPVPISQKAYKDLVQWRNRLKAAYVRLEEGSSPTYLTSVLHCDGLQLQAVFKMLPLTPDGVWRYNLARLRQNLQQLEYDFKAAWSQAEYKKEKFSELKWWWNAGRLEYDAHYNIRRTNRFAAEGKDSKAVRRQLQFIYDVPPISTPKDAAGICQDIESTAAVLKSIREYKHASDNRTDEEKIAMAKLLEDFIENLATNKDDFVAVQAEPKGK